MKIQEIEVSVGKHGQVYIESRGLKGVSGHEIINDLIDALGGETESDEITIGACATIQEEVEDQQHLKGGSA
jgi:hypothetical protein